MHFTTLPELDHALVRLRPLTAADLLPWFAYLSLPEVHEHTSWDVRHPDDLAPHVWRPESFTASSTLRFALALRSDDSLVGTAGFHSVAPEASRAEIAYDIAPGHWRCGIASAACSALVDWAHMAASVARVQATVLDSNLGSMAVLERCGFTREGLLPAHRLVRGRPGDFHLYAHLASRHGGAAAAGD